MIRIMYKLVFFPLSYLSLKYVNLNYKNALYQIEKEKPHCEYVCDLYSKASKVKKNNKFQRKQKKINLI